MEDQATEKFHDNNQSAVIRNLNNLLPKMQREHQLFECLWQAALKYL